MTKYFKYLIAILIPVLLIIFVINISRKERDRVPETPVINAPTYYDFLKSPYELIISFSEDDFDFPKKLPVYKIDQTKSSDDYFAVQTSSLLGVSEKPFINDDPVFGKTYLYSNDKSYLRIVPSKYIVEYKSFKFSELPFPEEVDFNKIDILSKEVLVKLNKIFHTSDYYTTQKYSLRVDTYGHADEENKQPNMAYIIYNKNIDNYPIVSSSYAVGVVRVSFNKNYELVALNINETPPLAKTSDYPLKSFNEFQATLKSSINLVYLNEGKTSPLDLNYNEIQKITLSNIELVYYNDNNINNSFIQPVFKLMGEILYKDNTSQTAVFTSPAIKTDYLN